MDKVCPFRTYLVGDTFDRGEKGIQFFGDVRAGRIGRNGRAATDVVGVRGSDHHKEVLRAESLRERAVCVCEEGHGRNGR